MGTDLGTDVGEQGHQPHHGDAPGPDVVPDPPHPAPWPRRDAEHLLVSSAQMAALESQLFQSGLPVEALMEKAALAMSRRLLRLYGPRDAVLVMVGPGHNGGDGLVVARELHLAGWMVQLWSPFERHKPLCEAHLRHALWLGIPRLDDPPDPAHPSLWIDALFGIGQSRAPGEELETLFQDRHRQNPERLVAVDVPTGLCAESGRCLGQAAAKAARTFCLGLLKQGLVQDAALAWVGDLERIDLGLPQRLLAPMPWQQPLRVTPADLSCAPWPALPAAAAKYGRGRVLVLAGSRTYPGAAHLALAGASASGCGSLRALLHPELSSQIWTVLPHVVPEAATGTTSNQALARLTTSMLERLDAVLVGPGLGSEEAMGEQGDTRAGWLALQEFRGLLVLDADALNQLARTGEAATWLKGRNGPSWLTPHPGELARLFPDLVDETALSAARAAANRCGAAVLLKGAHSVIASPDGRLWQLGTANAAVARAGLGDVLAGYVAGRGAMAMAALQGPELGGDAQWLAVAALAHAQAGFAGGTPLNVASTLANSVAPEQQRRPHSPPNRRE